MIIRFCTVVYIILLMFACQCNESRNNQEKVDIERPIENTGNTVNTRFLPPEGFIRVQNEANSFTNYLQKLPLKITGSKVKLYNGNFKSRNDVHAAVVDLPIGKKNLHQCADAIIRLRAEYYWKNKMYDQIHFNYTNGFNVPYNKWKNGNRIVVNGNQVKWIKKNKPSNDYKDFWTYLENIFMYAGTLSLEHELEKIDLNNIKVGDVFIQGGSPGHAIIVVDMAINSKTNEKVFILAQSYMPAQELHVLNNFNNKMRSPWYSSRFEKLNTPEWTFEKSDLKRFPSEN